MQIAISTESLNRNTPEALEQAAALGFKTVEINIQQEEFGYGYRRRTNSRFYRQLKKQLDELGLRVWSVTSPPLTQEQMFFERAHKDVLMSAAIAAGLMGAQVYVVSPADIFRSELAYESYVREDKSPPTVEGYDEAWVQAANRHITTAIRNRNYWIGALLTNQTERLQKVADDLAIGWAKDVRAALARNSMAAWLEAAGERLAVAHLYDLDEERLCAPVDDEWREWLPQLAGTRLKCCVIHAPQEADPEALARSRHYLEKILRPANRGEG